MKLGTSAASQMVEEKARILLSKNEFNTLRYYLDEYSCSRMSIDAFITILFELLNTTDKVNKNLDLCNYYKKHNSSFFLIVEISTLKQESKMEQFKHIININFEF